MPVPSALSLYPEVGKSQIDQSDEIHYGEYDGAGRGVLPGKLVEQKTDCSDDDEDEAADFNEGFHLNIDYTTCSRKLSCLALTTPPIGGYLFPPCRPRGQEIPLNLPLRKGEARRK